jgi:branched-chain amino acid transport system ATP-binding protein
MVGGVSLFPVMVLAGINLADELDQALYGLAGPDIVRHFHISPAVFGLAFLPNLFLGMALPVFAGYVADRVNRVMLSIAGALAWAVFAFLTGVVPAFWMLVVVRMLTGFGRGISGPAHSSLISDYYPLDGRGAAFSIHQNANPLGNFIGFIVAGVLLAKWGWQKPFLVLPIPGLLCVLLMLRLREPRRGAYEFAAAGDLADDQAPLPMKQSLRLLGNIQSWRRYAYVWLFLAIGGAMASVYSFYFEAVFGIGPFGRGLILAGTALLTVVGAVVGGIIGQRLMARGAGRRAGQMLAVALAASAVAFVATSLAPTAGVAVAIALLTVPVRTAAAVPVTLILSATVPARIRGQGFGAIWFFYAVGFLFLPIALSYGNSYSYRVSLLLAGPPLLVSAIIAAKAADYIDGDIERANKIGAAEAEVRRRRAAGESIDLLEVVDLDVSYGNVQVLFNVGIRIAEGEMVALLGTNGAGKSTLLKAISGVVRPTRGVVLFDGQDITGMDAEATAERGIIQVPGGKGVFPGLSVRRNLRLGTYMYRKDKAHTQQAFEQAIELFPRLGERLDQPAGTLSGGEQQMLTLAQAFMAKPRVLMIDELSLGLAPVVVEELLEVVERINQSGVTVILVEQSVNIALSLAKRAYFMEKGEVRFEGASADLLERGDLVRSVFLSGAGRA